MSSVEVKGKLNVPCVLKLSSVSWATWCTVQFQNLYLLTALDVSKLSSVFTIEFVLEVAPKPYNFAKDNDHDILPFPMSLMLNFNFFY